MNDFRLKVVDSTGHTIVSNLSDACFPCFSRASTVAECPCPAGKGTRRLVKKRDDDRREFFVCMQGGKKQHQFDIALSTLIETFSILAKYSTEPEGKKVDRLIHDVSGVLGRNHFYALIPQNKLMETKYQDQLKVVQDIQKSKPGEICKTLIYLHKDNQMMTHLFTIYRVLDCNDKSGFDKKKHKAHSLLLNVLYLWKGDFDDNKIHIHVADSEANVLCDFNTVQAAFILFLDNAYKYARQNSDIEISFNETSDNYEVLFTMHSLFLKPEDRPSIFEIGKRGELAMGRKDIKGQGIGMGRIRDLMKLNNGDFLAEWGDRTDSSDYVNNKFAFRFKPHKSGRRH